MLTSLASFYWRPDFGAAQSDAMIADFVSDLQEFPVPEVEVALQIYRRDPKAKFFPTPGAIREIILQGKRERAAMERVKSTPRAEPVNRPIMWWSRPKVRWSASWREADVPDGEMIHDTPAASTADPTGASDE